MRERSGPTCRVAKKCSTSSGMSPGRSRNGGRKIDTTLTDRRILEHVAGDQRVVQQHIAGISVDTADGNGGTVLGDRGVGQGRRADCVKKAPDVLGAIAGKS